MKVLESWFVRIVDFLEITLTSIIVIVIGTQIITRTFFNMPLKFPEEVAVFAMIAMIFGGLCMIEKEDSHLLVDVINDYFPKKIQKLIFLLGKFFILVLVGAIVLGQIELYPKISQLYTQAAKIPYKWLHIWMIIFTLIWGIFAIINIVRKLKKG